MRAKRVVLVTGGSSGCEQALTDDVCRIWEEVGYAVARCEVDAAPGRVDRADPESIAAWVLSRLREVGPATLAAVGGWAEIAELVAACADVSGLVLVDPPGSWPSARDLAGLQREWLVARYRGAEGSEGPAPMFSAEHVREWRRRIVAPVLLLGLAGPVANSAGAGFSGPTRTHRVTDVADAAAVLTEWRG